MDKVLIEDLKLLGQSPTTWDVMHVKNVPCYAVVTCFEDDVNNFVDIENIPKLIKWLSEVYAQATGELICKDCKNVCTDNVGIYYGKYDVCCRSCMASRIKISTFDELCDKYGKYFSDEE